ncbi:dnaJ homolog subfamily C member 28-like isoform X2 [Paramacrobiotus metropolitanus]|uniref:dnaJ homolog subfamily C member 28-like isoform X2 n=1 Tax=Paramacrobiotus metropolitanus TaxID=2943436 RepID=UPI002445D398|nr:dnaJ homolog subfamily C member 28-like isoform X2 [Paramacrobiotus metropolitanus]
MRDAWLGRPLLLLPRSRINPSSDHTEFCSSQVVLSSSQVSEDCSNLEVREAFVRLAKKYHPDSSESPDEERFRSIESAYRSIMEHRKFARPDEEIADAVEKELGFHHRAPAHRQYLSNEGFGYGTPSQRERQYQAFRLNRATENVYNYRVGKLAPYTEDALVTLDKQATKKFKTQNAIERVVEDLIQESMAKGEFTKLSGMGKPLNYADANPFVDSMTHKLNRILINNGFTPEWAVLGKEIENLKAELRQKLTEERAVYGEHPTQQHRGAWADFVQQQQPAIEEINQKVHKFNFICPSIQQQLCQVGLQHFADKIFSGDGWREVSKEKLRENMEKKRTAMRKTQTPVESSTWSFWDILTR